jgi:hypothetical protein
MATSCKVHCGGLI